MNESIIKQLKFNDAGLIPVITQDAYTNEVLMLAYMNIEAVNKTLTEKIAYYFSRSRKTLWKKGETSGHIQYVKSFAYDCDADTILIKVKQVGVACHTGEKSCFFNTVLNNEENERPLLESLYDTIKERKENPKEGSYTNYLFKEGLDKILKKVGEETSEIIIAAKNDSQAELVYEISDLVYHILVLMVNEGTTLDLIERELSKRRG
ncbi:bifunctional phosphoribosyl-AMP cyclohydrolase/phosphoribosyl-ATP diphosphatase HisIE [Liberiplasma polymorphum]|uniref:bifunctional phosphoribosyl-AMP cyclohydrolase/phosphoribosyl-ATP diphosphatase HisIE n=1 Tax=Liberiplasma polymorphum TaxID=3374570 RepID=UPI003771EADB